MVFAPSPLASEMTDYRLSVALRYVSHHQARPCNRAVGPYNNLLKVAFTSSGMADGRSRHPRKCGPFRGGKLEPRLSVVYVLETWVFRVPQLGPQVIEGIFLRFRKNAG